MVSQLYCKGLWEICLFFMQKKINVGVPTPTFIIEPFLIYLIVLSNYKPCFTLKLAYLLASSTATAQATVAPTIGLLPKSF